MKQYFRGAPGFAKFFWFWDLAWMAWSLTLAVMTHSMFQAVMGVAFGLLWVLADRQVKTWNKRYDANQRAKQEYEDARKKLLARLNGEK